MTAYRPILIGLGLLAIIACTLAGCAREEKSLSFWIGGAPQEMDYWETLIREFEEESGYSVKIVRQTTDTEQRRQGLVVSLNARQPDPDVFLMDVVWIGQFYSSGWLRPFDSLMRGSAVDTDHFFRRVVDLVDRYEGRLYALPVYVDAGLLYYRTDLLEFSGHPAPPRTWSELVEWAQAIQKERAAEDPDFSGFVWQGAQYEGLVCTFLEFAASNGGGMLDDNRVVVDSPENIEALGFMRDLIHQYRISPENTFTEMMEEEVRRAFQSGNALFERNWPYAWKLHQAEASPVRGRVGLAPLPHFAGDSSAATLGGWHVGISRYSDVPEQAWELVSFVTSWETQKKLVLNLGWNPGRTDLYEDPDVLAELPHLGKLRDVFRQAVARPNVPYYGRISTILQRHLNDCLAGAVKPDEALHRAQAEIEQAVSAYEKD